MKTYIEERAVEIANYIVENGATVRQTAKKFGVSKSTVHKDVTERMEEINPRLAAKARKILDINKSERQQKKSIIIYMRQCKSLGRSFFIKCSPFLKL